MPEPTISAGTIIKVSSAIISKAPQGIELVKSWWKGKTVLIVGQLRAGKTTFLEYFQHGFWGDEKETERTQESVPTARFTVKLGRNESLELYVSTVIDTSGQAPTYQLAEKSFEKNPHAILIFMDLTQPLKKSEEWLYDFCRKLEDYWRSHKAKVNRIRTIVLVLNKIDKVDYEMIKTRRKAFQKILDAELRDTRGSKLKSVRIMSVVMVTNPKQTILADDLIKHLAMSLD
jgi:GTPase SAR1 family protein